MKQKTKPLKRLLTGCVDWVFVFALEGFAGSFLMGALIHIGNSGRAESANNN